MRLGGGRVDSVNNSEGLKLLFPARMPETPAIKRNYLNHGVHSAAKLQSK
ncbi:hypothetical protein [Thermincola potens]|nr:hypothetical protein [Thermincola potens]